MDAELNLASTWGMYLSRNVLVCLYATFVLCVGCGPEPTVKQPTPSTSATTTAVAAPSSDSTVSATSSTGLSTPSTSVAASASVAPRTNGALTLGNETQPLVGTLTNDEILKAVNNDLPAFDACYTLGADKQGKLEGTITVKATVGPLGKVIDVAVVKSTVKNSKVNDCVGAAFKKVVFPQPKGGVAIVTYPMTFGGEVVTKK